MSAICCRVVRCSDTFTWLFIVYKPTLARLCLNDRSGRKALSRFRELSGSTPQIADLHCFEIHRTSSQTSAVPRSLLKTTLAYDYICLSIRLDFVGQIWGNLSAKPCPSMPIRPLRGYSRPRFNKLLRKRKTDILQHTDSPSQHNRGVIFGRNIVIRLFVG